MAFTLRKSMEFREILTLLNIFKCVPSKESVGVDLIFTIFEMTAHINGT